MQQEITKAMRMKKQDIPPQGEQEPASVLFFI